jgi:hypothetical protein
VLFSQRIDVFNVKELLFQARLFEKAHFAQNVARQRNMAEELVETAGRSSGRYSVLRHTCRRGFESDGEGPPTSHHR